MSLFGKLEKDVEIKSSAEDIHNVYSCRAHHISIMSPEKIQGVDLHDGEWGKPGSVICWNYFHDGKAKIAKEIIEAIDYANYSTTYKVIEGDLLKEYKSFKFVFQAIPKAKGEGSVVRWTLEYEKLNEQTPDPNSLLEYIAHCSKDVDVHLLRQSKK